VEPPEDLLGEAGILERVPEDEVIAFQEMGPPFFFGGWGRDVVGMRIGQATDWGHVAELLTESYRVMAPKTLAARLKLT
jgi:hypothetical protein